MSLTPRQQSLLDDLLPIDDSHERLAAVVDRARRRPKLPPAERSAAHRVPGCISPVWLVPQCHANLCHFRAEADSPVVLGLVTLLADFFSDTTPAQILASDVDPLETLGLTRTLSPTRRHGLAAVRAAIRAFAERQLPANSTPRE